MPSGDEKRRAWEDQMGIDETWEESLILGLQEHEE
jgi:hypothetical protein